MSNFLITYFAIWLDQGPTTARVDLVATVWAEFDPRNIIQGLDLS